MIKYNNRNVRFQIKASIKAANKNKMRFGCTGTIAVGGGIVSMCFKGNVFIGIDTK